MIISDPKMLVLKKGAFLSLFLGFLLFYSSLNIIHAQDQEKIMGRMIYSLHGEWEFRQIGQETWYKARVPGCVHTDLMEKGLIPDPYYRDNERKVQWIEKEDWEYRKEFELPEAMLKKSHIELVANGLDTYAKIFINGEKIAETENMFRGYRFEIKPFLRASRNEIRIAFDSSLKRAQILEQRLPYKLPGGSPHVRKAPYHFGWDWGPRLVTSGIWRPVFLEAWEGSRIEELEIRQEFKEKNKVVLHLRLALLSDLDEEVKIKAIVSGAGKKYSRSQSIRLKRGLTSHQLFFEIRDPALWWPQGLGEQNLYNVEVSLLVGKELLDSLSKRIGIRTLILEQKDDQWGKSFQFVVNGIPFFAKGGNWIPADMFLNRISPQKYERLLKDCVEVGMNMIRVWGGGNYESPEFYDLCDELGLVVWQDFMFACAAYPGDENFLENVRKEVEYVIKELRDHPCLALWCGNNECEEGWFHWGWKDELPAQVWEDYKKIFDEILPQAVEAYDPQRAYWPSSPHSQKTGDPRSPQSGDMHYWGIWHGKEPFEEYRKKFHRFMSEFGFQSFPLIETVKTFTLAQDWNITSPVMEHHQKNPEGNRLILHYMLDHYRLPKDFESLLWLSQILQAEGMKIAVEHFRSQMPRIMGSLYWQINDCWPVASWSGLDYFGTWKALHYYARRFYNPLLVAAIPDDRSLNVYCVSDLLEPKEGEFEWIILTYEGKIIRQEKKLITIEPQKSRIILSQSLSELKKDFPEEEVYFYCELREGEKTLSSNIHHFARLKRVSLPEPEIRYEASFDGEKLVLILESKNLAKNVYLQAPAYKGRFKDNFFDMIPGKRYSVEFETEEKIDLFLFKDTLKIMTLRDSY